MASHIVGEFRVEVLHHKESPDKQPEVIVLVFSGEKFLDYGRFTRLAFNSAELRRRIPALGQFSVQGLTAVIEDALEGLEAGRDAGPREARKGRKKPPDIKGRDGRS